jgi:hypothetical protein
MSSWGASGVLGRIREIGGSDNGLLLDDDELYVAPPELLEGPNGFDCREPV